MEKAEIINGLKIMKDNIIRTSNLADDVAAEDITVLDAAIKEIKQTK